MLLVSAIGDVESKWPPDILPSLATRFVMGKEIVKNMKMETVCDDNDLHWMCVGSGTFCARFRHNDEHWPEEHVSGWTTTV